MSTPRLHLPHVVTSEDESLATSALRAYFFSQEFTGGQWDGFDPSGTRAQSSNVFTADDALSTALLGTELSGRAVSGLLVDPQHDFGVLLSAVGPDRNFIEVDPDPTGDDMRPVYSLYEALKDLPDVGYTRASKLLARKRPRLFAIIDSKVLETVFRETETDTYVGRSLLHAALAADDHKLWERLAGFRRAAELPEDVSVLRVFDVLAWMEATGRL